YRDGAGRAEFSFTKAGGRLLSKAIREERAARLFSGTSRRQGAAFFTRSIRRRGDSAAHRLRQCLQFADGARDRSPKGNGAPARHRGESLPPDSSTVDGRDSACGGRRRVGSLDRFSCKATAPRV